MRYELCMFHMSAACMHSNTTNCHSLQLTSSLLILILNNLLFAVICLPVFDVYLVFSSLVMTSHSAAVTAVVQNPSALGLTKRAIVVCFNHQWRHWITFANLDPFQTIRQLQTGAGLLILYPTVRHWFVSVWLTLSAMMTYRCLHEGLCDVSCRDCLSWLCEIWLHKARCEGTAPISAVFGGAVRALLFTNWVHVAIETQNIYCTVWREKRGHQLNLRCACACAIIVRGCSTIRRWKQWWCLCARFMPWILHVFQPCYQCIPRCRRSLRTFKLRDIARHCVTNEMFLLNFLGVKWS